MRMQVVGIGADGWEGIPTSRQAVVAGADVLLGGARHLALVPETVTASRVAWPSPLRAGLPELLRRYAGRRVVVLASGDPLVSGVGSVLVDLLGVEQVEVLPAPSAVALARARMGWAAESVDEVTVVGRDPSAVLRAVSPGNRVIVLSSDRETPATVAALLCDAGYGPSRLTVWSDLGSAEEARVSGSAADWGSERVSNLNLVCIECRAESPHASALASSAALPDEAYEHDGQLTKQDLRASALARLAPVQGQLLWDVGAGAGSVGVEWMRTDPRCRAVALEAEAARVERIRRNAARLGVPGLRVQHGTAPEALTGLPAPDAVFVGGGTSTPGVLDRCWGALRSGGRLVAHAVTLESEEALVEAYRQHGGELTRTSLERATRLGRFTGWSPARAVVQWAVTKPGEPAQRRAGEETT